MRWGLIGLIAGLATLAPSPASHATGAHSCWGGPELVADVDGDRRPDRVSLPGRWIRGHGCRYRLIVHGTRGRLTLGLREGLLEAPRVSPEARVASLGGLARIDRRPGAEILVTLNRGASSSGAAVYAALPGRLRYLRLRSDDGLFWEAQAGLVSQVTDCWRGPASGLVITSSREVDPSTRTSRVDRRLFRVAGGRFRLVWHRRYLRTTRDFPEFKAADAGLFAGCRTRG